MTDKLKIEPGAVVVLLYSLRYVVVESIRNGWICTVRHLLTGKREEVPDYTLFFDRGETK